MDNNLKKYLSTIVDDGLEKNYWFMTKQTMSDFYFIFTIAKVIETYQTNKKSNENFGMYYSRFFSEDTYLKETYPKQSESENTYRNAIIAEFFGLFKREKTGYDSGVVTPAYKALSRYIKKSTDVLSYKSIVDRQIEKLCLNVNEKVQNYSDLLKIRNFPVMFLYKILFELYKRTGDSTLYYDEFVVFLVRSHNYNTWETTIDLILSYRKNDLDSDSKHNFNKIYNDVTANNIRFDSLFGILTNIEYSKKQDRNYYKIKNSYESIRYIENSIEIFEASKYATCNTPTELIKFLQSDKYFIGNLDVVLDCEKNDTIIENIDEQIVDESKRKHTGVNIILYGVPGAGKSYTIENEYVEVGTKMERVVFHPDYTYSDFVGQILPISQNGDVSYQFMPGPFTKIMKEAYLNPETKYILVIEEINRGNAPAIFGDIFQLLDRDGKKQIKNDEGELVDNKTYCASSYGIINADVARIVYGNEEHEVRIPSNLSIICTMNTSDQNVFTLDTAFQRRWNMRLIENTFKKDTKEEEKFAEKNILDTDVTWEQFCTAINKQILEKNQNLTSSEDKRLGTHFVNIDDLTYDNRELDTAISKVEQRQAKLNNRRFPEKVVKYLWDDAFKFYRDEIFKGEFDSLEKIIKEFAEKQKNERFNIFKDNIKAAIEEIIRKSQ